MTLLARLQPAAVALLLAGGLLPAAQAWLPGSDTAIVQKLDGDPQSRRTERDWQRRLQRDSRDAEAALSWGQALLERARSEGDARLAGRALAALQGFDAAQEPADIALLRATILQYQHAFDASATRLQTLLARPEQDPNLHNQAALLLASVRRTQGQLAASDAACARIASPLHAQACQLENAALRDPRRALSEWDGLLARSRHAGVRAWMLTSKAEHAQRAGLASEAEQAFRAALSQQDSSYLRCALADLLQEQGRPAEALALLEGQARSDAVAVRQAALARVLNDSRFAAWRLDLQQRFAQARERHAADPREPLPHLREQAMFALYVEDDAAQALRLARLNVEQQREALDLLLYAKAAQAAGQPRGLEQALRLAQHLELHDDRLPAPPAL